LPIRPSPDPLIFRTDGGRFFRESSLTWSPTGKKEGKEEEEEKKEKKKERRKERKRKEERETIELVGKCTSLKGRTARPWLVVISIASRAFLN